MCAGSLAASCLWSQPKINHSIYESLGNCSANSFNLGRLVTQIEHDIPESQACSNLKLKLPYDVHTAMTALSVEPKIVRSICCPKWTHFLKNALIENHLEVSHVVRLCGPLDQLGVVHELFQSVSIYSTQDLESWLQYFLSRPGIEKLIEKSYNHKPSSDTMRSVWDSPAWRSLGPFTTTAGNLTFSYYIDWFNPLTNKIAGKTVSCGAIMYVILSQPTP
jgi:hypothetical protein